MTFLASIFVAGLGFLNWTHSRSMLYPPVLFCSIWASILLGLVISGDTFYPLSVMTLLVCCVGCLAFSIGGLLVNPPTAAAQVATEWVRSPLDDKWTLRILDSLLVFFALLLPIFWLKLAAIGAQYVGIVLLEAVRTEMVAGDLGEADGLGIFRYVIAILVVATLIVTTETCRLGLSKWRLTLWTSLTLAFSVPTGSRLNSLVLFFGMLAIFLFVKKRIPFMAVALTGGAVLVLFTLISVVLGKGGNLNASLMDNAHSVAQSLQVYVLGGIVACDQMLRHPKIPSAQIPSLRFFYVLAASLGFGSAAATPSLLSPYVDTPFETNVYSVYYQYFIDFGWTGMFMVFLALGTGIAKLHNTAKAGRPEAITLLGMGCAYLVLTCAADPFLVGLSACLQSAGIIFLIYNIVPVLKRFNMVFTASVRGHAESTVS